MAFLDQVPLRPACIISALPKSFRDSLCHELKGSVAVSTCPPEGLEAAVRLQGATFAIVGASDQTVETAERLSHASNDLKVFLAHYKGEQGNEPTQNGFAGIFDLRGELGSLAAAIREDVARMNGSTSVPLTPSLKITALGRFVEMQRRIANPPAVLESMLDGFLDLVGGQEGVLLVPRVIASGTFSVAATLGTEMPAIGNEIRMHRADTKCLLKNSLIRRPTGFVLHGIRPFLAPRIAVPLHLNGLLCAVLLADGVEQAEALPDYLAAASFVFQQLARRQDQAERDRLLEVARERGSNGWVLADTVGRVIFGDGLEQGIMSDGLPTLKNPRLRDAIAKAVDEKKTGETMIKGRRVKYLPLEGHRGTYCLFVLQGDPPEAPEMVWWKKLKVVSDLLEISTAAEDAEKVLWREVLEGRDSIVNFNLIKLRQIGISVEMPQLPLPSLASRKIALLLIAWKISVRMPYTAQLLIDREEWRLTIEVPESVLQQSPTDRRTRPIFELTLQAMTAVKSAEGVFGIQLRGSV